MEILKKLIRSFEERGIRGTATEILMNLIEGFRIAADSRFDRKYNVNTYGIIQIECLDINDNQKKTGFHYEPTPVPALKFMLKMLSINHSEYTFIDYGSGKGRVLLCASEYPYKRIVGVEYSSELHTVAKKNIKTWKNPKVKCFALESICIDACDFVLPAGPLILFFFTPFKPSVICKVVNNIQESLTINPRPIQILYYGSNPEFIDALRKLNLNYKEIYRRRPFSAMKSYRGIHFTSGQ